jgi:Zn-dependent M28 family amino/carboxypeptidase
MKKIISGLVIGISVLAACTNQNSNKNAMNTQVKTEVKVPVFNADSAYQFVKEQVDFGPRVPNTKAHVDCGNYLSEKLKAYGAKVTLQEPVLTAFDGTKLKTKTIIGEFQPEKVNRLLLFAHWDSRPFAEQDENPELRKKAILGANDGASGIGVLLEIARVLSTQKTNLGIDIVFFDAEDYGQPSDSELPQKQDTWCLGSQYWSKNPHKPDYYARYGILLDMVGAKGARFYWEYYSKQQAKHVVDKIWKSAQNKGYSDYFISQDGGYIMDDHIYVMQNLHIPCANIIQYDPTTGNSFGDYWHTHKDDMRNIDKKTLAVVGQTVLEVIYKEK